MKFKKIVSYNTGDYVMAEIYETDSGRKVQWDIFMGLFDSQEKKFLKAHAWADAQIEALEKYSTY